MDSEMILFFKEARKRSLCESFAQKWVKLREKDDFVDFCLLPQAIPYMAVSMYEKWGLSKDYLLREFPKYINGKYISARVDGIDANAELFVDFSDVAYHIKNSLYHISHTQKSIFHIKDTICPIIHISNNSDVIIGCNTFNNVTIKLYDKSKVYIDAPDKSCKVLIEKFSNECELDFDTNNDNIKVVTKKLEIL